MQPMTKAVDRVTRTFDPKRSERERRLQRLAQQLRSNLSKRKAQSRGRAQVDEGGEVSPAGNTPQDS
jgi:hypothetical protein